MYKNGVREGILNFDFEEFFSLKNARLSEDSINLLLNNKNNLEFLKNFYIHF